MTLPDLRWGVACALLVSMAGCLESGSSGSSGNDQANGGIGGSGSGTVSGYGSIIINGLRTFDVETAALVLDGEPLAHAGDNRLPIGVSVEYLLADDAGDNLSSGTAIEVRATHQVIGPVTSMPDPLLAPNSIKVLGQDVLFSEAETHQHNGAAVATFAELDLQTGDVVAVSGSRDDQGRLHATRIARADDAPVWQLIGRSGDLLDDPTAPTIFTINGLTVSVGINVVPDCPNGVAASQKIRVTATPDSEYVPGDPLDTVTVVECLPDGLDVLSDVGDVPADLPVSYSGIVLEQTPVDLSGSYEVIVDGQRIVITEHTNMLEITGGVLELITEPLTSDDLLGERIDVDGVLKSDGRIDADNLVVLPALVSLLDDVVCGDLAGWTTNCDGELVYVESPLEGMAHAMDDRANTSISVLGLQPARFEVGLSEVTPRNGLSHHVLAALHGTLSSEKSSEEPLPVVMTGTFHIASLE